MVLGACLIVVYRGLERIKIVTGGKRRLVAEGNEEQGRLQVIWIIAIVRHVDLFESYREVHGIMFSSLFTTLGAMEFDKELGCIGPSKNSCT